MIFLKKLKRMVRVYQKRLKNIMKHFVKCVNKNLKGVNAKKWWDVMSVPGGTIWNAYQ